VITTADRDSLPVSQPNCQLNLKNEKLHRPVRIEWSLEAVKRKDQKIKMDIQSNYEITDLEEILQIMVAALNQKWDLSCLSMVNNRLSTVSISLVDLNAGAGEMTVDMQGSKLAKIQLGTHFFRAQTGGMSYTFKTRLM